MITSANAVNAVGGRFTPGRRKALYATGGTSALALGGAIGGRRLAETYYHYNKGRIWPASKVSTPRKPLTLGRVKIPLPAKTMLSHGLNPRWMPSMLAPEKYPWRDAVAARHVAYDHLLNEKLLKNPIWKRLRRGGLIGLGATAALAGAMALRPKRQQ